MPSLKQSANFHASNFSISFFSIFLVLNHGCLYTVVHSGSMKDPCRSTFSPNFYIICLHEHTICIATIWYKYILSIIHICNTYEYCCDIFVFISVLWIFYNLQKECLLNLKNHFIPFAKRKKLKFHSHFLGGCKRCSKPLLKCSM